MRISDIILHHISVGVNTLSPAVLLLLGEAYLKLLFCNTVMYLMQILLNL